jgi:hypothetical protein
MAKTNVATVTPIATPTTSIRQTTMLGVFSISMWSGRKNARNVAEKAEVENNAKAGALSAALHLMVGVDEHVQLSKNTAMNRKWWSEQSVAWYSGKGGPRAVAAGVVMDLQAEAGARMLKSKANPDAWENLVDNFCRWYESGYSARVFDLGDLYDPKVFPLPSDMRKRFRWSLTFDLLPAAADIRILEGIDPAELKRMEREAQEQERARIARATGDIAQRLFKVVESMHKTMLIPIGEKGGGFHGTKLENITQLAELIPSLNFMQDPKLAEMAKLAKKLAMKSPDELKGDEVKRAAAAKEAGVLASKLADLFGDEDDDE